MRETKATSRGGGAAFTKAAEYLAIAGACICLLIAVIVCIQVFFRYALRAPIKGIEELSMYLLVGVAFFPAAYTLLVNGHVRVDFGLKRLRRNMRRIVETATSVLALGYCAVLIWGGLRFTNRALSEHWVTDDLRMPEGAFWIIIPVASTMLFVAILYRIASIIKGKIGSEEQLGGEW